MSTLSPTLDHATSQSGTRSARRPVAELLRAAGVDLAAMQRPEPELSGDLLVVMQRRADTFLIALGDAVGRGPAAARLAHAVQEHLEERAGRARSLGDLLGTTNDVVMDHGAAAATGVESFMSLLLLELDPRNGALRIANAGHPVPLAVGRTGGVVPLAGHGPALGLIRGQRYREAGPLRLPRSLLLLAATDGVHEARDANGETFGRQRVARTLARRRESGPEGVVTALLDEVDAYAVDVDDRSAVAFRFGVVPADDA